MSSKGILPESFPVPLSVKDVHNCLGICNYYHRFIKDFAKIASSLHYLRREDITFAWSPECDTAFKSLTNWSWSPLTLSNPDFKQAFHPYMDASQTGHSLSQTGEGKEHVISYCYSTSFIFIFISSCSVTLVLCSHLFHFLLPRHHKCCIIIIISNCYCYHVALLVCDVLSDLSILLLVMYVLPCHCIAPLSSVICYKYFVTSCVLI